jgi:hypothetical protein
MKGLNDAQQKDKQITIYCVHISRRFIDGKFNYGNRKGEIQRIGETGAL